MPICPNRTPERFKKVIKNIAIQKKKAGYSKDESLKKFYDWADKQARQAYKEKNYDRLNYVLYMGDKYNMQLNTPLAEQAEMSFGSSPTKGTIADQTMEWERKLWKDGVSIMELFEGVVTPEDEHLRPLIQAMANGNTEIFNKFKVLINRKAKENSGMAYVFGNDARIELGFKESSDLVEGEMSPAEVYVHEMVHMAIEVGRKLNKGQMADMIDQLSDMHTQAKNEITPEMLAEATGKSKEESERLWNYMFKAENGIAEFVAYGMTNKGMKKLLSDISMKDKDVDTSTLFGKLSAMVVKVYEYIAKALGSMSTEEQMDARLGWLVTKMMENNQRVIASQVEKSMLRKAANKVTGVADKVILDSVKTAAGLVGEAIDYMHDNNIVGGRSLNAVKNVAKMVSPFKSSTESAAYEKAWSEATEELGGILAPESMIMNTVNYLQEDDKLTTEVERFGLMNQQLDQQRETNILAVGGLMTKALKRLSRKGQIAVTSVMVETDMSVLMQEHGIKGIKELYKSASKTDVEVKKLHIELDKYVNNPELRNFYKSQAKGLGRYLATHEGSSSISKSAAGIVYLHGTGREKLLTSMTMKQKRAVRSIVDRLASVEAIGYTREANPAAVEQVMKIDDKALEQVVGMHASYTIDAHKYAAEKKGVYPNKGEIKDLKPEWVQIKVADGSEKTVKKMKELGFKQKGKADAEGMFVYTSRVSGMAKFNKQAVAKINSGKRLHAAVGVLNRSGLDPAETAKAIRKIELERANDLDAQFAGIVEPKVNGYEYIGAGRDGAPQFAITVNKETYSKIAQQDKRLPILMGKMKAEIAEKRAAEVLNGMVMNAVYKDMAKNYRRGGENKNNKVYLEIGPDAKHDGTSGANYAKEVWDMLPDNVKGRILARKKGQQFIAVRRDMATMYFGSRSPSLLNAKIPFTGRTLGENLDHVGLSYVHNGLKLTGDIWQEVVSMQKVDIVMRTPAVLRDNIWSNFNYQWALGQWPWEVAKSQLSMYRATKKYMENKHEEASINARLHAGERSKELKSRLVDIKKSMRESAVRPLMEAGLFTSVVEDISNNDLKTDSKFDKYMEDKIDKVPKILRDAGSALYITEDTGLFRTMMMATQYSDFVARASRFHFLVGTKGYSEKAALKMVLDEFVNYNRASPKTLQWLSEKGAWMFHKYLFGSTKSMIEKVKDSPTSMLLMDLLVDMPNPTDSMPWNKDLTYTMNGPLDIALDGTERHILPPSTLEILGLID